MLRFSQDQCCPFRTTLCLPQNIKYPKSFKKFPETAFKNSLRSNPSCHTLSKVFDISKNSPLTSSQSSNDLNVT